MTGKTDPFEQYPVPTVCCLFILAFCISLLNVFCIATFIRKSKHNRRSSTYATVAKLKHAADYPLLLFLTSCIIQGFITVPAYALKKWKVETEEIQMVICDTYRFSFFFTSHISLYSLVVSSFDRIIALTSPFKYRRIVTKRLIFMVLGTTIIMSLLFDVIPFFSIENPNEEMCHYIPFRIWSIIYDGVTILVPLPILIINNILTIRIAQRYHKKVTIRNIYQTGNSSMVTTSNYQVHSSTQLRAAWRVILMIVTYILCWWPLIIYYLLLWLCKHCFLDSYEQHDQWTRFFIKVLVHINAVISPLVFAKGRNIFRRGSKHVIAAVPH